VRQQFLDMLKTLFQNLKIFAFLKIQGITTKHIPHRPVIVSHQVDAPLVGKMRESERNMNALDKMLGVLNIL